jgi:nicotinamide-nucleotide amidase
MFVGDKQNDLKEALRFATGKAALVIVTGGLGPTENDITREALSDFTGITLKEHPDVLQEMAQRFSVTPARLRPNLRRQTQVPTRGTYFKNPNGTAVGLVFELADVVIVALPGPPRELQAMVCDELVPYLGQRFGTRPLGCSLTLRFVGLGQSQIDQMLDDHVHLAPDITVSSQFQGGRVDFTFSLPGDRPRDQERLQKLKQKIMKHLGEYVYADDETSLEEHVVVLLKERDATLALAEVGLEKLRRLLRVPGDHWAGSSSRSQRIERLAAAAADAAESQWAVAVGEKWADESGNTYVDVAFKLPDGRLESRRVRLRGTGELARLRLSTQLQDHLRRRLK